jgi:hypothetical protein
MSDRRVVIGKRSTGESGIFIAPVGLDAFYAVDSQLILSITGKVSQILKIGFVLSSQYVPLGYGAKPYILLTGVPYMSSVPGYGDLQGATRPSPIGVYGATPGNSQAEIAADGSGMSLYTSQKCCYAVFNKAFA